MTLRGLMKKGYRVTAEKTGADYPKYAPTLGMGWEFVLTAPDGCKRGFTTHKAAWCFAQRLNAMIA